MAPFQENNMGDTPREYMEFVNEEEDGLEQYNNRTTHQIRTPDGRFIYANDSELKFKKSEYNPTSHNIPEGYEEVERPFTEVYETFEQFMCDYCGFDERDPEQGVYGYWSNPNSEWDWYVIGGRFRKQLLVHIDAVADAGIILGPFDSNEEAELDKKIFDDLALSDQNNQYKWVDYARMKDVLWELMSAIALRECGTLEEYKARNNYYKPEYLDKRFGDEEMFKKLRSAFTTYAVLTPDREWLAPGSVSMFGASSSGNEERDWDLNYYDNFLKNMNPEKIIVIIDCHV